MTALSPCPICKKPAAQEHKPFCSSRCANIDLGRWFQGNYAIPDSEKIPDPTDDPDES